MRSDDADIDALMGAVVGHNGKPAEFPPEPELEPAAGELADVVPIRPGLAPRPRKASGSKAALKRLSAALSEALETNERERVVIDPRTVPARFSRLKHFSQSALHYWQACQDDLDDTISLRFGRGVHALVLGTPVKKWTGKNRNSNDYKNAVRDNPGVEYLTVKEWDRAHGIFEAIQRHPIAHDALFREGTILEQTLEWEFAGKRCTSRPDARLGTDRLVDLKTTKCAEPTKFKRDAIWRGYHSQFSFYGRAIRELFGSEPKESLCVAVETKKPFAVTVFDLPKDVLAAGEKSWRLWFEQLLVCEASNRWPGYSEVIETIDGVPDDDVQLIVDGEEFDFDDD